MPFRSTLRRIYFIRFAFALVWAALMFAFASAGPPLLTVLVVIYPLVDAVAVFWQLRAEGPAQASRVPEWINVALSVAAALVLGWASTISVAGAITAFGIWAIASGAVQLTAAVLRRQVGGQVPLIVSGAVSVLAGFAFTAQGLQGANSAAGIGGYAIVGGTCLIAAIRLGLIQKSK